MLTGLIRHLETEIASIDGNPGCGGLTEDRRTELAHMANVDWILTTTTDDWGLRLPGAFSIISLA